MTTFEDRNNPEFAMAPAELASPARVSLSLDVADRLLGLLSTDDSFRGRFEANPRAALREIGYETPDARIGVFGLDPVMSFCHFEGGLASKAQLASAREVLRKSHGEGEAIFGPFSICAD